MVNMDEGGAGGLGAFLPPPPPKTDPNPVGGPPTPPDITDDKDKNKDTGGSSTTTTTSSKSTADKNWTDTSSPDTQITTDQNNAIVQSGANPDNVVGVRQGENGNTLIITANGNIIGVRPDGTTFDAGSNKALAGELGKNTTNNVATTGSTTTTTSSTTTGGGGPSRPPDTTDKGLTDRGTSKTTTTSSTNTGGKTWENTTDPENPVLTGDQSNAVNQSGVDPANVVGVRNGENGNTLLVMKNGDIIGVRPDGSTFGAGSNKALATNLQSKPNENVPTTGSTTTTTSSTTTGGGPSTPPDVADAKPGTSKTTTTSSARSTATNTWENTSDPSNAVLTTDQSNAINLSGTNPDNVVGVRQGENGNTLLVMKNGDIVGVRPDGSTFPAGSNKALANQLTNKPNENVPTTGSTTTTTSSTTTGGGPSTPPDVADAKPGTSKTTTTSSSTAVREWTNTSSPDTQITTDQRNAIVQSGANSDDVVGIRQGENGNMLVVTSSGKIIGVHPDGTTFDAGSNKTLADELAAGKTPPPAPIPAPSTGGGSTTTTTSSTTSGPGYQTYGGDTGSMQAPPGVVGPVENVIVKDGVTYWIMSDGRVFAKGPNGNVYRMGDYGSAQDAVNKINSGPQKAKKKQPPYDPPPPPA